MACEDFWDHLASLRSPRCFCAQGVRRSFLCDGKKKSEIQSGYFLWVHLGVGVYIEMVVEQIPISWYFMRFHQWSKVMIQGRLQRWMMNLEWFTVWGCQSGCVSFLHMILGYKKLGRCTSEIFKKDRQLQEIYGNMGTNKWTGIKLGVASQLESG